MKKELNKNLNKARKFKNNEFYTQLTDIEKEMKYYKNKFKNKIVYCNCDDPQTSNFVQYFLHNFNELGLKRLIASYYKTPKINLLNSNRHKQVFYFEYKKCNNTIPCVENMEAIFLKGNGDFKSQECLNLLKQSDIIVTNPPFSLFREFILLLMKFDKKFIVLGSQNAIIYKDVFPFIRDNKLWLGVNNGGVKWFQVPNDYQIKTKSRIRVKDGNKYFSMGNIMWYTNIDIQKRHKELILHKKYSPKQYPKYDNYNAIEVTKYSEIPMDFNGIMGVPITFLDKYNPKQFEIIGSNRGVDQDPNGIYGHSSFINGKETFKRLFIKNKNISK